MPFDSMARLGLWLESSLAIELPWASNAVCRRAAGRVVLNPASPVSRRLSALVR